MTREVLLEDRMCSRSELFGVGVGVGVDEGRRLGGNFKTRADGSGKKNVANCRYTVQQGGY